METEQKNKEKKLNIEQSQIKYNEPMKKHTTFKVGGNADIFITIKKEEELKEVCKFAKETKTPIIIIGNGSNILVTDKGIRGIVAKIDIKKTEIKEEKDYAFDNTTYAVTVYVKNTDSGTLVPEVVVKNGNEKKCSEIEFYNSYNYKQTSNVSKAAKTGDATLLAKWVVLAMLSFACILVILWNKRNHRVKKDS